MSGWTPEHNHNDELAASREYLDDPAHGRSEAWDALKFEHAAQLLIDAYGRLSDIRREYAAACADYKATRGRFAASARADDPHAVEKRLQPLPHRAARRMQSR